MKAGVGGKKTRLAVTETFRSPDDAARRESLRQKLDFYLVKKLRDARP
ncbi:MAG: hypothetical protein P4L75_07545 [Clostridia bacterium]|nr:hypothetical protein [Clostridia bacterium]MDR3644281.1 hypothetical protein [Clostridia bacterium]